jgi:hypothetical protein
MRDRRRGGGVRAVSRVDAYGISLELPAGWEANAFRHEGGEPTVHVASFRLPRSDGEFGTGATGDMPHDGLFLALTEYRVADEELGSGIFAGRRPRSLEPALLSPHTLLRPVAGQSGLQRFFTATGRAFCLYVVAGSEGRQRLDAANVVLASLQIGPRR